MKQYIYSSTDVGLPQWPSGTLRLEGIDVTTDPAQADVFVVPGSLTIFKDDLGRLDRLPYIQGREDRLCIFDVSDHFTQALNRKWMIIRCDARTWMLKDDPNTISIPWPVEDYAECVSVPGAFRYDVSAHMWTSTHTRIDSAQSCLNNKTLKCDIALYENFTGYIYHEAEGVRRRGEFRRSMRESRVALCPESIPGVLPYRFFEAMSAGRIPVLVSSDYVLPMARDIPYSQFCLFIERDEAAQAGQIIQSFLAGMSDELIANCGRAARLYWKRYLDSRDWPKIMAELVREHLGCE